MKGLSEMEFEGSVVHFSEVSVQGAIQSGKSGSIREGKTEDDGRDYFFYPFFGPSRSYSKPDQSQFPFLTRSHIVLAGVSPNLCLRIVVGRNILNPQK